MSSNVHEPEQSSQAASRLRGGAAEGADALARIAANAAPVLIWMCGPDRRHDWFNAAWEAYTGHTPGELRGNGWRALVHPEDAERCSGIFSASFDARQPYSLDFRLRRYDGQYRWMLENGVPRIDADGALAGYIGSLVDIEERKQVEDQLAERTQALRLAERRQGAFLALLSHELRNPLAPIANAASVLRTLEDRNPILTRLREILERQVGRLDQLIDDLVDVTRSAHGQISLINEQIAADSLVHAAAAASAEALNAGGHTLDISTAPQRLCVRGDLARLTQALSNVISNAAKFTPEPSVISLAARQVDSKVEISVRDPGQGIAAEFLPHVFELFAQQEPTPGRRPGGLGIGLTLARRIMQLHNGDIEAHSEGLGQGACFVLTLPRVDAEAHQEAGPEAAPGGPPLSDTYRVLVIEDDADSRALLRQQMEMWGNEVREAASAEEGLRATDDFRPHIVICDIGLPGAGGAALLKPLRARLAGQRSVVVAVTGPTHRADQAEALAAGYDSFLMKPLQPESLARLLRSYAHGSG
jgi:PAS domain S-box-containing protein